MLDHLGDHHVLPQILLDLVVIDEAHRYRGLFGTHVALVLRRLQRLCARLGAAPRFVLASGTIANPAEHGAALIGRPVTVVDDDGAPSVERVVALWDSVVDPDRSAITQTSDIVATLATAGERTLCFTGSRLVTELVAAAAAERAPNARISAYRAGFTPRERREIEHQLREGLLDAVVSTNALELGINIGGLDAVVLSGYPGTIASTWQQIGRGGRAGQDALAILVAGEDALDQYLLRRPQILFGSPVERAVVSLDNPEIARAHVLCAAAELPLRPEDAPRFGSSFEPAVADLKEAGLVTEGPAGTVFSGDFRPATIVRLDGRADDAIELRVEGAIVEVLERWRAMRSAHEGAIFLHRGQRYEIVRLDLESGTADAVPVGGRDHTEPVVVREYRLDAPLEATMMGEWRVGIGRARIRQRVIAFKRHHRDVVIATVPLEMPPIDLDSWAVSMVIDASSLGRLLGHDRDPAGALHAAEHGLIHAMPFLAMCDRDDAGGISTLLDAETDGPLMLVYDGHDGGAGIAQLAYGRFSDLARLTLSMVESCDCPVGCPRCVYDRSCGNGNEPMDRLGAVDVLRSFVARSSIS